MVTKYGRIIDQESIKMTKHYLITTIVLIGILAFSQGCKRKSSPAAPDAKQSKENTSNEEKTESTKMVLIPAGSFIMGDEEQVDAKPHEVTMSSFYIDTYLVTQAEYEKLMHDNPSRWKGSNNPIEQVRWSDAVKYCNARSQAEGLQPCYDLTTWKCDFSANGYRLPTEAEWEYACRAGTKTAFFFGDDPSSLKDYAWFDKNASGKPHPVGQKTPNPWDLYDMCGNVWEWCNDFYKVDYYQESPKENPRGPETGETKIVRGGAWKFSAECCRSGYRYNEDPGYADVCFGYDIYGFRCVRNIP